MYLASGGYSKMSSFQCTDFAQGLLGFLEHEEVFHVSVACPCDSACINAISVPQKNTTGSIGPADVNPLLRGQKTKTFTVLAMLGQSDGFSEYTCDYNSNQMFAMMRLKKKKKLIVKM